MTLGAINRRIVIALLVALSTACTTSRPEGAHTGAPAVGAVPPARSAVKPAVSPRVAAVPRPPKWAKPLTRPGLPNLFRVSDKYYRGAQPTPEGIKKLPKLGVRTIVNLRSLHSDDVSGLPLSYQQIRVKAWHAEHEDAVRFLKIVTAPANQPVFVHCQHGADRTGMMTAVYRIVVQGWSKEDAIREMTEGGYGFHPEWENLVDFVRKVDVKALRHEVGIPAPAH